MKNKDLKNNENLFQSLDTRFKEVASLFSEETLTSMQQLLINGGESYRACSFGDCNFRTCSFNTPCKYSIICDFKNCDWVTTLPPTPTPEEPE